MALFDAASLMIQNTESGRTVYDGMLQETFEALLSPSRGGGAHALAMAIYKDTRNDPELRLEAAKAAMPYEKPRLSAVEHSGSIGTSHEERLFERLKAEAERARPRHDA